VLKSALIVSGLIVGLSFSATAQISSTGGPIQIEADRLDFFDNEARAVYRGNVDAIQGDARIRAKKLTINFEKKESTVEGGALGSGVGDVKSLVAEGDVYYMTPGEKAKGDRGVYDYKEDRIVLTGNVTLTRGENVIVGDRLIVNVGEGRSRVESDSRRRGERVRTVIVTSGSEES
tara:strand:+ start:8225 stop:8752 length:528 start_codon:yes stop_codon:yes gene_type:complete